MNYVWTWVFANLGLAFLSIVGYVLIGIPLPSIIETIQLAFMFTVLIALTDLRDRRFK